MELSNKENTRNPTVAIDQELYDQISIKARVKGMTIIDYVQRQLSRQLELDSSDKMSLIARTFENRDKYANNEARLARIKDIVEHND